MLIEIGAFSKQVATAAPVCPAIIEAAAIVEAEWMRLSVPRTPARRLRVRWPARRVSVRERSPPGHAARIGNRVPLKGGGIHNRDVVPSTNIATQSRA